MINHNEAITLHFGTKPHNIDARTLVESFGAFESALRLIATHSHPDVVLKIRVNPFKKGSFEVPIEVQQSLAIGALAVNSIDWNGARDSVKILLELIKLKLSLKGKEPTRIEKVGNSVTISGNEKTKIHVDNRTYNIHVKDAGVADAVAKSFQALEADKEIKSFSVLDKQRKKIVSIPRKSFGSLSKQRGQSETKEQRLKERATLQIFKAVFDAGYKWDFLYKGFRIPASITDANFQMRVASGEKFGRGDALDVDLEIVRVFDEGLQAYVNKAYSVLMVHGIINRPSQGSLGI